LKRFANKVVLAFDADNAGQGAAERFYAWESKYKVQVSVAKFPDGKDPGDLASSNPLALADAVKGAQPFLGFRLQRVIGAGSIATPEARSRTAEQAMAVINEHPDMNVRKIYAGEVASHVGIAAADLVRLAERGVRFIQLFHRGWDQHVALARQLPAQCRDTDQPSAALIMDLKRRGLLDDTLVIWGAEFGRTVYSQGQLGAASSGRDHHGRCFSVWLAGGGIKPGSVHGETDDFGWNITRDPVHLRDLHATMLNQLGLNHERFVFPYRGLDQKLVGVEPAKVVKQILA
jgi:uncharacterized protein (DUF1501 family)